MTPETRGKIATVKAALKVLAGVCDGAQSLDGLGFNKIDSNNDLLRKAVAWAQDETKQKLSYRQITTALRLIQKYQKQLLRGAAIALPDRLEELDHIIAADERAAAAPAAPVVEAPAPPPSQRPSFLSSGPPPIPSRPAPAPTPAPAPVVAPSAPPAPRLSRYELAMRAAATSEQRAPVDDPPPFAQHNSSGWMVEDEHDEPGYVDGDFEALNHVNDAASSFDDFEDAPPPPPPPPPPEQVDPTRVEFFGTVVHIKFGPSDNGFVICSARIGKVLSGDMDGYREVVCKGTIASCKIGAEYKITGKWVDGGTWGQQIQVQVAVERIPENEGGLISWLTTIPDIGPARARAIVKHFGVKECRELLHDDPMRVQEVPGIGPELGAAIARRIEDRAKYAELIVWLGSLGVSHSFIDRIREMWGEQAQAIITANPYRLMEIPLIGFKKADAIARSLGIPFDSPFRIAAGILHAIDSHCSDKGHCYVPRPDLLVVAAQTLKVVDQDDKRATIADVPRQKIGDVIDELVKQGDLVEEIWEEDGRKKGGLWPKDLYDAEHQVAKTLVRLLDTKEKNADTYSSFDVSMLEEWQSLHNTKLAKHQEDAVIAALSNPVFVMTGGPGTGKTTTVRAIVDMLDKLGRPVALAAPTGRAARRLGQATGRFSMTIHRMVGLSKNLNGQRRGDGQWSDAKTIIIDEVSMVDLPLMRALVKTLHPTKSQIILVGDIDQLPSVGPGSVLRDVLNSGVIPSVRLTQVFRQQGGHENRIVSAAHSINSGVFPDLSPYRGAESLVNGSMCWIELARDETDRVPGEIIRVMRDLQEKLMEEGKEDDPFELSQVLAPQRTTDGGVKAINDLLQAEFNPNGVPIKDGYWIRTGDKVMQIRNNYDLDVFNGDVGYIADVDPRLKKVVVNFEGKPVTYKMSETEDLVLAYGCTIHKSQGSEYRVTMVVCVSAMYKMLSRQLIYTGVTRGKSTVIIIGDRRAIERAVANGTVDERYTRLSYRLRECLQRRSEQLELTGEPPHDDPPKPEYRNDDNWFDADDDTF